MLAENTYSTLLAFKEFVVLNSKRNLVIQNKNTFGNLSKALDESKVSVGKNSFQLDFTMPMYGQYQDKGVSGTKTVYATAFSYKTKMPPTKSLDKWIVKKGIAPRNKEGKFVSREGLKFAIAKKIFLYGIKPSLFFTKPFEEGYTKFINTELEKAFAIDAVELFKYSLK
jgi:hypothetical protein